MRRFEVWIDRGLAGHAPLTSIVEMADDATDAACERACADRLKEMIGSEIDTGWRELKIGEAEKGLEYEYR